MKSRQHPARGNGVAFSERDDRGRRNARARAAEASDPAGRGGGGSCRDTVAGAVGRLRSRAQRCHVSRRLSEQEGNAGPVPRSRCWLMHDTHAQADVFLDAHCEEDTQWENPRGDLECPQECVRGSQGSSKCGPGSLRNVLRPRLPRRTADFLFLFNFWAKPATGHEALLPCAAPAPRLRDITFLGASFCLGGGSTR